jgi:hypothetical protein
MNENVQIIPYYAHPHVFTVINDNTQYDETTTNPVESTLPFSTVVVAGADQGIDNKFIRLTDLNEKIAIFGEGNFSKYGQASLQADFLFNGSTNVWFCRVLPDNATYSNMILLAKYRKGNELDELGQETGLKRMEIKFSIGYAASPYTINGALTEADIIQTANSLAVRTADPQDGYYTLPLFFVRSTGRGVYGNNYSIKLTRDNSAELEYETKMYMWSLISNGATTRILNKFSGSLIQKTYDGVPVMISDVLDMMDTGKCPIDVYPFEDTMDTLYEFYQEIISENETYLGKISATDNQKDTLATAQAITKDHFDPIFGYVYATKSNEIIPYYQNYTVKSTGVYVTPDMEVATSSKRPTNIADWNTAVVGSTVLVLADENNGGYRWRYTIEGIDSTTGNITYDEGVENYVDDNQYDGVDISIGTGHNFKGGSDGDFSKITIDGVTRKPNSGEMKLLLAKEEVKAFRGEKDRTILSPSRIDLDFMFDANYNMTQDTLVTDSSIEALYGYSTVLSDTDYATLTTTTQGDYFNEVDLNVKKAMYDLNEFRNRNGMTIDPEMGAGCSLYLDCNSVGLTSTTASNELNDLIDMMEDFNGRATSIDLGYYEIFDPYNGKRIAVTSTYFIAENLIPHIMNYGLNKPFVFKYAQMTAVQKSSALSNTNTMIRDSFRPDIDLIDWDVKERLYKNRFNYYLTRNEGRTVQRACQNTRQLEASALLEENNVRVLNTLKKGLESACNGYLYEWNEPAARKGYTDSQMAIYRPWIGTMVADINIRFDANEWEQERMVMHCYVDVTFRDIIKRIILEININRADYSSDTTNGGE